MGGRCDDGRRCEGNYGNLLNFLTLVWAQWHTTATPTDSLLCTSMEGELPEEHSEPAIRGASDGAEEPQEEGFPSTVAGTQKDKRHWRRGLIKRKVVGYGGYFR